MSFLKRKRKSGVWGTRKELSNVKSEQIKNAELRLLQCDIANYNLANQKKSIVKNIGNVVNGVYPDYSPVISLDGSALYYTSRRPWENGSTESLRDPAINQYPEDVYVSYMDFDATWTEAMKLDFCLHI